MQVPAFLFLAADESIPQIFGLNWAGFIAQVITFGIVLYVLKTYAFQPIIDVLEERRRRISEGQANAEKIKQQLAGIRSEVPRACSTRPTRKARSSSTRRVRVARPSSSARWRKQRRRRSASPPAPARQTQLEHDRVLSEVKRELGRLVIETTSKVTGKVLTPEDQQRLGEETTRQIA